MIMKYIFLFIPTAPLEGYREYIIIIIIIQKKSEYRAWLIENNINKKGTLPTKAHTILHACRPIA